MTVQSWVDILASSLQNLWLRVINFLPELIGAIIVLIVGLIIATGLGSFVEKLISALKIDNLLRRLGLETYLTRAGLRLNTGRFLGEIVKWFLIIAFVLAACDILGLFAVSGFLRDVLLYFPNVIVAALIMLAAVLIGNFLRHLIKAPVRGARLHGANFLGALTWYSIITFGFLAALMQIGVAVAIINTLITGFVAMLAIAGGIAFGLGGKDFASSLLGKFRDQVENK